VAGDGRRHDLFVPAPDCREQGKQQPATVFQSCSFDDDGITYELPDWMLAAGEDLEGRYGEQEGKLRLHKAAAVLHELLTTPEGMQRFEEAYSAAAHKMTFH
jgi:hypothetical protein